ncbi:hypothetical protein [Parapedobacter tibetensis]|uniref:hypothetical protein n=1 Tax=Parapedobacter tibetensis TaxID=2972951 RepID=UPI00214DBD56|nr:hypothetical protein [Parapedobacter tibetensis]
MLVSKSHILLVTMALKALTIIVLMFAVTNPVSAQRNKGNVQQSLDRATDIVIDGKLDDWGDTLIYEYTTQNLRYHIKNDDDNLYVAVRVNDKDRQMQIFAQGLAFMVNTRGKKREGPTVYFPVADRLALRSIMSADNDDRPDDMRKGALKAIRAIYVMRFDDVLDGQISLENTYGIDAQATLDTTDAMCVEMVVPLERLGVSISDQDELAFNVKINGVMVPGSGSSASTMRRGYPYGYGYGYPYGYGQQTPSKPREESGVWVKAPLARE